MTSNFQNDWKCKERKTGKEKGSSLFHDPAMTLNKGGTLAEKFCNQHQEAEHSTESYKHIVLEIHPKLMTFWNLPS